jgi:hypothetical protein
MVFWPSLPQKRALLAGMEDSGSIDDVIAAGGWRTP